MFLEGKQWLEFDERMAHWRVRENFESARGLSHLTVNLILNTWRSILARLSTGTPGFAVAPASDSAEDRGKASATEIALRYWWQSARGNRHLRKAIEYMATWGTAALHVYFDPGLSELRQVDNGNVDILCPQCNWFAEDAPPPPTPDEAFCPRCGSFELRIQAAQNLQEFYPQGMVKVEAVRPYNLYFEPGVRQWEDSRYIGVRRYETRRGLMQTYPAAREQIRQAPAARPIAERMDGGRAPDHRVEVFDIYWRDGRHAVVMNNVYLWQEVLPFPQDLMPVRPMHYTAMPDRLWGYGVIEPLLDAQWEYNRTRSQVADNARLMANPKWLVPRSAEIDQGAINDEPGEVVWFSLSGGRPEQVKTQALPAYVLDHAMRCQQEMMDVVGLHSTTMGKRSVGVTAAKAMRQLADLDVSQLMLTMDNINEGLEDLAVCSLALQRHYYTEPIVARMMDSTGSVVLGQISQTSILEQPEVFIEAGTTFRMQIEEREMRVLEQVEAGLLSRREAREELAFRTTWRWKARRTKGLIHAREMLAQVIRGHRIEILPTDDVEAFAQVFSEFMQTNWNGYLQLPEETQEEIRNIQVACALAQASDEEYWAAMLRRTIYPRSGSQQGALEAAAVAPTGAGQDQQLGAALEARMAQQRLRTMGTGMGRSETMSGGGDGGAMVNQVRGRGLGRRR